MVLLLMKSCVVLVHNPSIWCLAIPQLDDRWNIGVDIKVLFAIVLLSAKLLMTFLVTNGCCSIGMYNNNFSDNLTVYPKL